jgi:hypothetical protein
MEYAVIKSFNGLAAANLVVGPGQSVAVLMMKAYKSNGDE